MVHLLSMWSTISYSRIASQIFICRCRRSLFTMLRQIRYLICCYRRSSLKDWWQGLSNAYAATIVIAESYIQCRQENLQGCSNDHWGDSSFIWFYFLLASDELNCLHNVYHLNGGLGLASLFLHAILCYFFVVKCAWGDEKCDIGWWWWQREEPFIAYA